MEICNLRNRKEFLSRTVKQAYKFYLPINNKALLLMKCVHKIIKKTFETV